jgi:predicted unusual protein kinase regulating ubiquinone biosynthesis (AarF/ABC1/UbiB family)
MTLFSFRLALFTHFFILSFVSQAESMKVSIYSSFAALYALTEVSSFQVPSSFQQQHQHQQHHHHPCHGQPLQMSSTLVESQRLTKAKQLLEDFSSDLVVDMGVTASANTDSLPDSYWQNGHLQEGSIVVTRWAGGVKVAEPLVAYDPVAAEQLLFRQPTKWVIRNIQIALPIGWWAACVVIDFIGGKSQTNRKKRAKQLLQAISGLGPAIIKGGQALASRPDLLPSEYLEELQKLQDDVPRFSNEKALRTVEQELGIVFGDVFELLQEEPVAAASIGQVYKAKLLSNGDVVALKIQRPNCEEIIALDLYVLRWWSGVYNQIFKILNRDINVQSIIDDFGELIYREIDYVAEAANAQRFNELYARDIKDVFVPKVYSDLTTPKVLTMEWVDGFRLTDNAALELHGLDRQKLVDTLVQCSLKQILENGFFHADPHAGKEEEYCLHHDDRRSRCHCSNSTFLYMIGNLLACEDGRLCYLDFGMMSYAAAAQRNGFLLAVVHIVNRDWEELVLLYQRLGFIPEGTDLKPIEVALEKALPDVLSADISELNFKNVVSKLGDIMYTYPFSLPPFYIAIIRCLGVLEGLAIQVDPQARIISEAYPYVASRVLTDSQSELQEALRRLALNSDGTVRWERLESLLKEAKGSSGYDVTAALDLLTDYLISDDGAKLLTELSIQIVDAADSFGAESMSYLLQASKALAINDEVAAVKAFRAMQAVLERAQGDNAASRVSQGVTKELKGLLPEATPTMKRFNTIVSLLGNGQTDPAKFVPIVRKLSQEPRVQRLTSEIIAQLGERMLSRGLRAVFGLPPPSYDMNFVNHASTVTEDRP